MGQISSFPHIIMTMSKFRKSESQLRKPTLPHSLDSTNTITKEALVVLILCKCAILLLAHSNKWVFFAE